MVTTQALADEICCYVAAKVYTTLSTFVDTSNIPPSDWFLSHVTTVFQPQWKRRKIENEGRLDEDMVTRGRIWLTSSGEAEESHGTCKVPTSAPIPAVKSSKFHCRYYNISQEEEFL